MSLEIKHELMLMIAISVLLLFLNLLFFVQICMVALIYLYAHVHVRCVLTPCKVVTPYPHCVNSMFCDDSTVHACAYFCVLVLLLAGDIESNPGPVFRTCPKCHKPVHIRKNVCDCGHILNKKKDFPTKKVKETMQQKQDIHVNLISQRNSRKFESFEQEREYVIYLTTGKKGRN